MRVSIFGKSSAAICGMLLLASPGAWAFDVEVSNAPENDLALTVKALQSAQKSILLNIYELTSAPIADALMNRIQAGVHVEIIEEGQPVGGLSAAAKGVQADLARAMQAAGCSDHLYEMTSKAGGTRRYRFDHAKYAVIDDESVLIGSENYSPTGNPNPGSLGNRGWEVWIHEPSFAADYRTVFQTDSDVSRHDIMDLTRGAGVFTQMSAGFAGNAGNGGQASPVGQHFQATSAQRITSPDTSLSGLTALIQSAKTSLDIEQMTFDPSWGPGGRSPLLDAIIAAARRGVTVRVLLNDESVFNHPGHPSKPKNTVTVDQLNQLAQSEGLHISARIANIKAMGVDYIHNKGLLVDGDKTLISSINWDENAVEHNREAAVIVTSQDVHSYYEKLFESDWRVSQAQPPSTKPASAQTIVSATRATQGETVITDCPAKVRLIVTVGKLVLDDAEDSDFEVISGRKLEGDFTRVASPHSCVLVDADSSHGIQERKVLELRERSDGTRSVNLEGYTPKTQKIYSIRASIASHADYRGNHDAVVYDGSGPSKEKLGTALVEIF